MPGPEGRGHVMTVSEVARRHGYGRLVGLLAVVALFLTFKLLLLWSL